MTISKGLWLPLILGIAVLPAQAKPMAAPSGPSASGSEWVYIGAHSSGSGTGVSAARLDVETGHLTFVGLAAEIERPTWLVANPKLPVIYSVSETGNDGLSEATVYSLAVDPKSGKLAVINKVGSGGGGATHLALDPRSHTVFVANFGGGQVAALPIRADGGLLPASSVQQDAGSGPSPRQKGPHAHAVAVSPDGRFVLSADLGADKVFVYKVDASSHRLAPADPPFQTVSPGSGPRHLAFLPNGRFVLLDTELSGELQSFDFNRVTGRLTPVQTLATAAPTYAGAKSAAELAVSRDGRFAYVSNRGEDTLVVYALEDATGRVIEVQRLPSGGKTPWSFTIDPSGRWMIVANEGSDLLTVFHVDPSSGRLAPTNETLSISKPVNLLILPGGA